MTRLKTDEEIRLAYKDMWLNVLFWVCIVLCYLELILIIMAANAYAVPPEDLVETRYVTEVNRSWTGKIRRSSTVVRAFKKAHPCPSTMKSSGPCKGYQVDHVIPLACGGKDSVSNMQWLPVEIKTCKGKFCKDRIERRIYAHAPPIKGADNCKREVVK